MGLFYSYKIVNWTGDVNVKYRLEIFIDVFMFLFCLVQSYKVGSVVLKVIFITICCLSKFVIKLTEADLGCCKIQDGALCDNS